MYKLGFIGCGNMGYAMVSGALKNKYVESSEVIYSEKRTDDKLQEELKIYKAVDNKEVAKNAELIILAVKPNVYGDVIEEIKDSVADTSIVMPITPSFTIEEIQNMFGKEIKVARAMPNTPAMVNSGMTGVCFSDNISEEDSKKVVEIGRASCRERV